MQLHHYPLLIPILFTAPALALDQQTAAPLVDRLDPLAVSIDSDGVDRIEIADRIAMLTQRVAASSCALSSGIDPAAAEAILAESAAAFERLALALRDGDPALGLPEPEANRHIRHDVDKIMEVWTPARVAVDALLVDGEDVESAHVIDDRSTVLLDLATQLVTDVSARYSHPYEIAQIDSVMVKLAGRQRMLTQKMAKDACEIWTDYNREAAVAELTEAKAVFDASIRALRHGLPAMGIPAAPNETIATELDIIIDRWDEVSPDLDALLAGETLDADRKFNVFHGLEIELGELDLLLTQYLDHAERHH